MPSLISPLSVDECLEILGEQMEPQSFFSGMSILRPQTSRVVGRIDGHTFELKATSDRFSKCFVAELVPHEHHTEISYHWIHGFGHSLYGAPAVDEGDVLDFLREWLQAVPEDNPDDGDTGDAGPWE
jgi:hypothetical protein